MFLQRILIGLDDGELAQGAVDRGIELAGLLGSRVDFVHASREGSRWLQSDHQGARELDRQLGEDVRARCLKRLREQVAAAGDSEAQAALGESLEQNLVVAPGHPAQLLLEQAERFRSELLLLGSHRPRRIFDFGNTARTLLAHAPCPIWSQPVEVRPVKRILVPTESAVEGRAIVEWARHLAKGLGAEVTLLRCFVPPDFAWSAPGTPTAGSPTYVIDSLRDQERAEFDEFLADVGGSGVAAEGLFVEGSAVQCVLEAAREGFDLIVMGTHGRARFSKEVLGSVAYGVLRDAECPVVVAPIDEELFSASS